MKVNRLIVWGRNNMANSKECSRGYQAGRAKSNRDINALQKLVIELEVKSNERQERVYMQCLALALNHCDNWTIGKKKINDADGYCSLAKVFADNSISKLDE